MNSQDFDIIQMAKEKIDEELKKMGHFNILISGKTGVGKSTLVNAVFGSKVAETGVGNPITQHISEITVPGKPLRIYDTVGLELSAERQEIIKKEILDTIEDAKQNDKDKLIHCIWYCINANSNRIEQEEIDFMNSLAKETGVSVIIVLTQSYGKNSKDFKSYIDNLNLNVKHTFCILAEDYEIDDDYTKKAYGCDKLVEFTAEIIPEEAQKAFIAAQTASLKAKHSRAMGVIAGAVTAAFGEGFLPIPCSDAAALVPTQMAMIAGVTAVYGVNVKKSVMTSIVTSLLGTTTLTIAGKTIVSNLLKFIPGVGTVVGGMISGGTAGALTGALGRTYMVIMEKMLKGEITEKELENKETYRQFTDMFKENLKHSDNKSLLKM